MAREGKIPAVKIEHGRNNRVIVRIPYNKELIDRIKTVEGRRWNTKEKYWEIPYKEGLISMFQTLFGENLIIDLYFYFLHLEEAGIKKDVTVCSLRHSFATHLLESGV